MKNIVSMVLLASCLLLGRYVLAQAAPPSGGQAPATSSEDFFTGTRTIALHSKDGQRFVIGMASFKPTGTGEQRVEAQMKHEAFKDFFLSMKEFKCLDGGAEIFCHVAYPYSNPATISATNLAWLEHQLLFLYKTRQEFGANLWQGIYFELRWNGKALEGKPQAIDLNKISAPPSTAAPPYRKVLRDDISPGTRWIERLTIE